MRVLVCGSRTFRENLIVFSVLNGLHLVESETDTGITTLIEGGAKGADALGAFWAHSADGVEHLCFPANWDQLGKRAGPIRNQQMLDEGEPEMVLAFVDKPLAESRGTNDMVTRAKGAGVPTYVIERING
jgi:hypothetical protein